MVSFVALALVVYLIWKDPTGTADVLAGFFKAVGGFFGELWDRLGEFVSSLFGKK